MPQLRQPVFHILLALSDGDLHGLGIAEAVDEISDGSLELGPGTLYRSLSEMVDAGLIRQVDSADADPRRKYYRITAAGRRALREEAARLGRLVEQLRARQVLPEAR